MVRSLTLLLGSLACCATALSHHGFGTFDRDSHIVVSGTITGVDFVNPHSWVYFDVHDDRGNVSAWRCEMRAATVLRRSGWSPGMFVPGEPITITGAIDLHDSNSCYLSTAVFADGSSADRYGQLQPSEPARVAVHNRPLRLPGGEPNISGDWAPEQLVMTDPRGRGGALVPLSAVDQFEPGQGRIADPARPEDLADDDAVLLPHRTRPVQLTAIGAEAAERFGVYTLDNPRMRCETTSILFDWTFDGPVNRITQEQDRITLAYGQLGLTRVVHMGSGPHPENIVPSRSGYSIGRWEDDVLIVETAGFEPGVLSPPVLHSDQLRVVERFSLDTETMALTREYTAEDPVYFHGQYSGSDRVFPADLPHGPDPCTELTFIDYSVAGQPAAESGNEPVRPWWRFRE